MKNKSFFKSYGLYIILLVACVSGLIILGLSLFAPKSKTILMKDLKNLDKSEVDAWVDENNLNDYVTYSYEYSVEVEKDKVISQSLGKNVEVDKKFTVVISKGSIAEINNTLYADKNTFESFIKDYKNVIVTYCEEENEAEKGKIINFSKGEIDLKKDELTVTVSLGKDDKKEEEEKKEEPKDDGKTVLIPNNLLGIEEAKFIKTLNDLGFKNLKKDSQKYYSFNSKKDTIFSYDDGKFDTSKTINYAISLGDYISDYNKFDYEGKTLESAKKNVDKYNALNAHITLNTNNVETTVPAQVGLLSNCSAVKGKNNNSIITCNLNVMKEAVIIVPTTFLGKTERQFIEAINVLGIFNTKKVDEKYSSYPKGTVYKYDSGNKKTSDTITYGLSLGQYVYDSSKFEGQTLNDVNAYVNSENNKGAGIKFSYTNVPNDQKTKNTLYDCTPNGTTITCKLANNKEKYKIINKSLFIQSFSKTSYEATKAAVEETYKDNFVNLHFNAVKSELAVGAIVDVKVNGSSTYTTGNYDYDCSFEVYICSEQE